LFTYELYKIIESLAIFLEYNKISLFDDFQSGNNIYELEQNNNIRKLGGKKMKRIFIAIFLVIIMIIVPVTTAIKTADMPKMSNISPNNVDPPQFYITIEELYGLYNYIDDNFEDEKDKTAVYELVGEIISFDLEVDIVQLADASEEYGYRFIPDTELDQVTSKEKLNDLLNEYWVKNGGLIENLFGDLVNKIIELIKGRLGWIYQFFTEGGSLFVEGVNLIVGFIQGIKNLEIAKGFVSIVNVIISVSIYYFSQSIKDLFSLNIKAFLDTMANFTQAFTNEIIVLIDWVTSTLEAIGDEFQPLVNFLAEVSVFIDWLVNDEPWNNQIKVCGVVSLNAVLLEGATVICRGISDITDSDGQFSFYVNSNPDENSFPPNEWFGMHDCVITVSKDGSVLKETPGKLSYVFSGGEINWIFFIIKGKPKNINLRTIIIEKFNSILEKIHMFLPNFFKIINRVDIYSI